MDEMEALRQRRMAELQARVEDQQAAAARAEEIAAMVKRLLSPEARQRLAALRAANPELAAKVEALLAYLAQSGRLQKPLSDAELRAMLAKLAGRKRETKITRKSKTLG
jgi:programmed cell death protein 5